MLESNPVNRVLRGLGLWCGSIVIYTGLGLGGQTPHVLQHVVADAQ